MSASDVWSAEISMANRNKLLKIDVMLVMVLMVTVYIIITAIEATVIHAAMMRRRCWQLLK